MSRVGALRMVFGGASEPCAFVSAWAAPKALYTAFDLGDRGLGKRVGNNAFDPSARKNHGRGVNRRPDAVHRPARRIGPSPPRTTSFCQRTSPVRRSPATIRCGSPIAWMDGGASP